MKIVDPESGQEQERPWRSAATASWISSRRSIKAKGAAEFGSAFVYW